MQTAQHIYANAPLGSLIRYGNGQPRPPERFKNKVRAWESANGVGRLVERRPGTANRPASITLHLGDFESEGIIIMIAHRHIDINSTETLELVEPPIAGTVRVLTHDHGHDELRFLARDMTAAGRWMNENRYRNMRAEVVPSPDPVSLPEEQKAAA